MSIKDKIKTFFADLDNKSNKKEKRSRKQKIYQAFIGISLLMLFVFLILLGYSVERNILWLKISSAVLTVISPIPIYILEYLEEKEFQRVTNKSIDYYKRKFAPFIVFEIIAILACIAFAYGFIGELMLSLDMGILYSICIGTFSLVPIIYVFILPEIKKVINSSRDDLNHLLCKPTSQKSSDIQELKQKQGEIYKLINSCNQTNTRLIISVVLFILAIFMFFNAEEAYTIAQVFPAISIFYSLYEIWLLIKLSRSFYSYNKRDLECEMKKELKSIENKEKLKHEKELLKIYSQDGKLIGEETRKNCLKKRFTNYYKTGYLIIKNRRNKFCVYHKILNYDKSEYCWQASFNCDEISKRNLQSSFRKEIKNNFNITLNKKNFTVTNKFINKDKHQIIEIYLYEDDITNTNIDYNIDLYLNAKFVSLKKFCKILKSNEVFSDHHLNEIYTKLIQHNKK